MDISRRQSIFLTNISLAKGFKVQDDTFRLSFVFRKLLVTIGSLIAEFRFHSVFIRTVRISFALISINLTSFFPHKLLIVRGKFRSLLWWLLISIFRLMIYKCWNTWLGLLRFCLLHLFIFLSLCLSVLFWQTRLCLWRVHEFLHVLCLRLSILSFFNWQGSVYFV